jgi:hypothetical protein
MNCCRAWRESQISITAHPLSVGPRGVHLEARRPIPVLGKHSHLVPDADHDRDPTNLGKHRLNIDPDLPKNRLAAGRGLRRTSAG